MAKSVVGLDIGSKFIKIVQAKQGKKLQVQKLAVVPTPQGSMLDGEIRNRAALTEVIKKALSDKKIKGGELYFSINSPNAVIREMKLPALKKTEVGSAVEFELSQSFPGIAQTHTISFKTFSPSGGPVEGIAAFCPTKILDAYVELGKALGITVKAIDVSADSAARTYNMFSGNEKTDKPVLMVDIGNSSSNVSVVSKDRIFLSRYVSSGIGSVDNLVASRLGIGMEQAERARVANKYSIYDLQEDDLLSITRLGFSAIEDQIRQTMNFYSYNKSQGDIERILLMGGGSSFAGLDRYLQEIFGIKVSVFTPVMKNAGGEDKLFLYLSAIGACITSTEKPVDINLLPTLKEIVKSREKAGRLSVLIVAFSGLAVVAVLAYIALYFLNDTSQTAEAFANMDIKKYEVVSKTKSSIDAGKSKIDKITAVMKAADESAVSNTGIMNDIGKAMNENVFTLSYALGGEQGISISGKARDRQSIADFVFSLKKAERFDSVILKSISTIAPENGGSETYDFSAEVRLGKAGNKK